MSNKIIIARPETETLEQEARAVIVRAGEIQITTADEHGMALDMIKALREREKKITEHFEPSRKALDSAKKEILAARDSLVKPLAEARGVLSDKAITYQQEQELIAREAQAKIDAEARKKEEKRLAAIKEAEAWGDEEEAERIQTAVATPAVKAEPPAVAKVQGAVSRTTWSAEVIDMTALIVYVSMETNLRGMLLEPCMKELNRIAVAEKENMAIPGVKAVPSTSVVTR